MIHSIAHAIVATTDRILEAAAPRLPGVAGAGLFWQPGVPFWDAWTEGKGTTVRMGRVALEIDWK